MKRYLVDAWADILYNMMYIELRDCPSVRTLSVATEFQGNTYRSRVAYNQGCFTISDLVHRTIKGSTSENST